MTLRKKDNIATPKWFGYALQGLIFLATHDNNVCHSGQIAEMIESQATLMRRLMAELVKDGLVEAKEGRDGGYRLAKPANLITLADVYRSIEMVEPLSSGIMESLSDGLFGQELHQVFAEVSLDLEQRVLAGLERRTLADLFQKSD